MRKLILVVAALALAGCSSMGSLKAGHPVPVPVDCTGYLESSALNRTYEVPLIAKRVYESGLVTYRVGKGNPFHGQNWIKEYQVDYIKCDGVKWKVEKPF